MALTDTAAKNAKADPAKPAGAKLTDGQGLYLLVKSAGKYWRFDYRFADKRKTLGKSCKTLRNVWYMSACNGILTGHEAKQP